MHTIKRKDLFNFADVPNDDDDCKIEDNHKDKNIITNENDPKKEKVSKKKLNRTIFAILYTLKRGEIKIMSW